MAADTTTGTCTYLLTDTSPCDGTGEHPVHAVCAGCGIPSDDLICADHKDALARGKIRCSYCACPMVSPDAASLN